MQLGWIDYSKDERNKVISILRLLGTQTAVDELGVGVIRDAFSDILFPGISTLQSRAKYFVIIPYLFREAEKQHFSSIYDFKLWFGKKEDNLTKVLVENSKENSDGIIGSRVFKQGRTVKIKPSIIYWNGLRVLGIIRYQEMTFSNVCELTMHNSRKQYEISLKKEGEYETSDDKDALNDHKTVILPIIPDYDVLKSSTIVLTKREAVFLYERFTQSENTKNSLMAFILKNKILFSNLEEINLDTLPSGLRYNLGLALDFANYIYGAHLLYNVIYSDSQALEISSEFNYWLDHTYKQIDLDTITKLSKCSLSTITFLQNLNRYFMVRDIESAKKLIIDREKAIKRDRAKLNNPSQYRYTNPVHYYKFDYRFNTAKIIIQDILDGLVL